MNQLSALHDSYQDMFNSSFLSTSIRDSGRPFDWKYQTLHNSPRGKYQQIVSKVSAIRNLDESQLHSLTRAMPTKPSVRHRKQYTVTPSINASQLQIRIPTVKSKEQASCPETASNSVCNSRVRQKLNEIYKLRTAPMKAAFQIESRNFCSSSIATKSLMSSLNISHRLKQRQAPSID